MKFIYTGLIAAVLGSTTLTSCEDYLDVNDNPNYPTTTSPSVLLPSACASLISVYGYYAPLIGNMWMQYTTQGNTTNQYNTLTNYSITADSYNNFFTYAYSNTLPDLKDMMEQAEAQEMWDYWVIGKLLTAYNYHMLADIYEDIPFTEALDVTNKYPKYDDGKTVVYPGVLSLIDEALAKMPEAKKKSSAYIDRNDMFLGGDMDKWEGFAKNLKLKIMMRDFNGYKNEIQTLLNEDAFFEGDCGMFNFEDATDKGNPLYEANIRQLNTKENMRACHTFLEFLLANNDPRIEMMYEMTTASGKDASLPYGERYEGLPCGGRPETDVIALSESSRYLQAYDDPMYLMNEAEVYFLEAEALARLGKSEAAKAKYDAGVTAAFNRWDVTAGKATSFIAEGGAYAFDATSEATMLKCILTQKWAAYAKANSLDGVFDRNRTGIPAMSAVATVRVSDVPMERTLTPGYELGTLVDPGLTELQPREFPRRMLIPRRSSQYNPNAPETKELTEPMWWQVANGK